MSAEKVNRSKTLTLSLRLDPKTRFMLEFMAKLNRQNITTVVEEALRKAGALTKLKPWDDDSKTWRDFWDVSEGVRAMLLLADDELPSSFEDDEVRAFISWHIEFFSETNEINDPDRINVEVLWPHMDRYLKVWRDERRSDPWQAGRLMTEDLEKASVHPPNWPRPEKQPPKPKKQSSFARDLDDEVPF